MNQNIGVAFASFKDKDCVSETMEEIDIVKTKLVGREHFDILDIKNWEVEPAIPTNDIIWQELNKGSNQSIILRLIFWILPIICSCILITPIIYFETELIT